MGIFDKLKKSITKSSSTNMVEDDTKLWTNVIYNSMDDVIILISYSSDYFYQMIEFVNACRDSEIKVILTQTSYDEDITNESEESNDKEFKPIKPERITHQRYYALIAGTPESYAEIYSHINTLSNDILLEVQNDIYNNFSSTYFDSLIENSVLNFYRFKYKKVLPPYNAEVTLVNGDRIFTISDCSFIKHNLPAIFHKIDIISIMYLGGTTIGEYDGNDLSVLVIALEPIIGKMSIEDFSRLYNTPKYMIEDDSDTYIGDISDETLDDIFKQKYDRFNAISSNDIEYEDIDEELSDEESENIRSEDIANDN